jgi:hypothetical protein
MKQRRTCLRRSGLVINTFKQHPTFRFRLLSLITLLFAVPLYSTESLASRCELVVEDVANQLPLIAMSPVTGTEACLARVCRFTENIMDA